MRNIGKNFCVGASQFSAAYLLVRKFCAGFGPKTRDFGLRLAPVRRSTTPNHLSSEVVGAFAKLATKMRKFAKPSWRSLEARRITCQLPRSKSSLLKPRLLPRQTSETPLSELLETYTLTVSLGLRLSETFRPGGFISHGDLLFTRGART